jgi:NitT/TauT family transport system substrate-binding protein
MSQPIRRRSALGAIAIAAIGAAPFVRAQPQLTKLTLTLEFTAGGFHSPLFLALQKGWFKEVGVDLTIVDGKGSAQTISLVGAGQSDLGYSQGGSMAIGRAKGVPVKTVATILNKACYGLVFRKGEPYRNAADFKGKQILYNTASHEGAFLEGFLESAKMTKADVKLLGVDASSKLSSVLSHKGDAAVVPVPYFVGLFEGKNEIDSLLFSDFGVKMADMGIVTSENAIKTKSGAIKGFVAVMSRAYQAVLDGSAEEAANALALARPDLNLNVPLAARIFRAYRGNFNVPATEGKPVGFISDTVWNETIETLKRLQIVESNAKAADMVDKSFMPT